MQCLGMTCGQLKHVIPHVALIVTWSVACLSSCQQPAQLCQLPQSWQCWPALAAATKTGRSNKSGQPQVLQWCFPRLQEDDFCWALRVPICSGAAIAVNNSFANIFLQVVIPVTRLHSNLVWATASCLARWTTSRHTWNPIQCLLLHISLQELSTLDVLEVLVQSCPKL